VSIEIMLFLPLRINEVDSEWGVSYASDASLVRGNWICGGPLDF